MAGWTDEWLKQREHKGDPGNRDELLNFPIQHSCSLHVAMGQVKPLFRISSAIFFFFLDALDIPQELPSPDP